MVCVQRKSAGRILVRGRSVFVLLRPSTDCVRHVPPLLRANMLYSKSTDLNANLIQKIHL